MKEKVTTKQVNLSDIVVKFYTRRDLSDDKVEMFALLMEEGTTFPPIEITPEEPPALIDGRTRMEAYKLLDRQSVNCNICPEDTPYGYKARALKANYGGSQPNSKEDLSRTIQAMLQDGATPAQVVQSLAFIPAKIVKKLVEYAAQTLRGNKINQAKRDMRDGATIEDIKKKYGKDGEWIINKILETKNTKEDDRRMAMLSDHGAISTKIKSLANLRSRTFKKICELYEEGIISTKDAFVIFTTWRESTKVMQRGIDDYIARFISLAHDDGLEYQPQRPSKVSKKTLHRKELKKIKQVQVVQ